MCITVPFIEEIKDNYYQSRNCAFHTTVSSVLLLYQFLDVNLDAKIDSLYERDAFGGYHCKICGKNTRVKQIIRNHVNILKGFVLLLIRKIKVLRG